MKQIKITFSLLLSISFLISCNPNPDHVDPSYPYFENGFLVMNEGAFSGGVGSLSYAFCDNSGFDSVRNNIFQELNGRSLGNLANYIHKDNSYIYVVMNGAATVEVLDKMTLESRSTVVGFKSPRQVISLNDGYIYVSDWGANAVYKVDVSSSSIVDSLKNTNGPEGMFVADDKLFVANSGGYELDSSVSIYNLNSMTYEGNIPVGIKPLEIIDDAQGNLWVLCSGYSDWSGAGGDRYSSLVNLDPKTLNILTFATNSVLTDHPSELRSNSTGSKLYFIQDSYNGNIIEFSTNQIFPSYPNQVLISHPAYGLAIDRSNGAILVLDALDYQSPGKALLYSESGSIIDSSQVGLIPAMAIQTLD
jgi:hypothetical protein